MTCESLASRTRCRQIVDDDIDGVVALLERGFPERTADYWRKGLVRQRERALPPGLPRYGYMIVAGGCPVGVILLLSCVIDGQIRVNLSSWYVDPEYRMHASMLVFFALKRQDVTYLNISPARHTWPTIEAQGFRRYTSGQFIGVPALRRSRGKAIVHRLVPDRIDDPRLVALPERDVVLDHLRMGWLCLVVEASDGFHPFVFVPFRIRSGRVRLPARQLVFCRDIGDYLRFAGLIGRHLLRDGVIFVVHDANAPEPGMLGYYRDPMAPKYCRGPHEPRRGDLAYTERVIFGP